MEQPHSLINQVLFTQDSFNSWNALSQNKNASNFFKEQGSSREHKPMGRKVIELILVLEKNNFDVLREDPILTILLILVFSR